MGAFVLLDVHGADLYLVKGDTKVLEGQQHIGFVLEPIAVDLIQGGKVLDGDGPEARLGVGDGHAAEDFEHQGGGVVAEPAAGGNIRQRKVPAAQNHMV